VLTLVSSKNQATMSSIEPCCRKSLHQGLSNLSVGCGGGTPQRSPVSSDMRYEFVLCGAAGRSNLSLLSIPTLISRSSAFPFTRFVFLRRLCLFLTRTISLDLLLSKVQFPESLRSISKRERRLLNDVLWSAYKLLMRALSGRMLFSVGVGDILELLISMGLLDPSPSLSRRRPLLRRDENARRGLAS